VRLALGTASALGLARFAYGLLVPAMRSELGWNLAQAGTMTTANGLGYLAGAVATAAVARRLGTTVTFRLGMVLTTTALAATAATSDYPALLTARATAGFAGALVFITGGVLASRLAVSAGSAVPITVYFSGAGLGIALSGATIPPLLDQRLDRWPLAWAGLAVAAGLATAISWAAARSDGDTVAAAAGGRRIRPLWRTAVAYMLFAAGYIAYITYLSAYLTDQHASTARIALTWTLLGLGVLAAPALWNRPIAHWAPTRALAGLLAALGGAATLALLSPTPAAVLASAVAYGATFMAVPAAVTALIRTATPPAHWTPTLAAFTALFAAGQAAGPWIAGALADHTTPSAPLAWTAALCATAAALAATERTRT
jgi:predicted MFS family arabinose efflux permease